MNFVVVGLSHKTAPVEVRERLNFPISELLAALRELRGLDGIAEGLILSTCNRVEVVCRAEEDADAPPALASFLARSRYFDLAELQKYLYSHTGREALRHLFRVASSLDSMILGEPQILGQVKQAYAMAKAAGAVGGLLEEVLTRAFAVAKKVRSETGIAAAAVSVSYAAVELAKKIFGDLNGKTMLVIGAGKMSELAAKHLLKNGAASILVTNRTFERAQEMAHLFGGRAIRFEQLADYIPLADIVITSSAAPHYLIHKEDGPRFLHARKNRPMFFIDIAVPRNVDPALNDLDNLFVYDIDDLQQVVEANLRERMKEAERAEQIVEHEVDRLVERLKTLEVVPTIVSLQERLEEIRRGELERARRKLGPLEPEQEEALEEMTRSIINKILHTPITQLKSVAQHPDGLKFVEFVRRVFNLKS